MQMAHGRSVFDNLFTLVERVTITEDNKTTFNIPSHGNGFYLVFVNPNVTSQQAVDRNVGLFKAGSFLIWGDSNTIAKCSGYTIMRTGKSDSWTLYVDYTDSTKEQLEIRAYTDYRNQYPVGSEVLIYKIAEP